MSADEVAIIDDDREWVESATQTLREAGFPVCAVTSAEQGSDLLARASPALIVIDVQLPGYNGLHLLSEFRRRNAATPVLVVSGDDRASVRDQALTNGANGFLQKPLSPKLLLAAVRRFLGRSVAQLA
jgi:two-component system C4-dicarboxylate transport response regulator DctD